MRYDPQALLDMQFPHQLGVRHTLIVVWTPDN